MKRNIYDKLLVWKKSIDRKPLIMYGARQVGKTWLARDFARREFRNFIEVDFLKNPEYCGLFNKDLDPIRIIKALEITFKTEIVPNETLIFFDEIQECQHAVNSLKYFDDVAKDYHIIAAGSFLGLSSGGKFPVGKTDSLTVYPMSFYEFLSGIGYEQMLEPILSLDFKLLSGLSHKFIEMLKTYFYVGGMPEVVDIYTKTNDLSLVRKKQTELLLNYDFDFSNHIHTNLLSKVRMIWDSIPSHLAKEKKRFIYKDMKQGARASAFEDALNKLEDTRLVHKVRKTLTAKLPLDSYQDKDVFKLYMLDVGLLCAKSNIDISSFYLSDNNIFNDFQGALAEQFVLQELKQATDSPILYWGREKGEAEIDFILQYKSEIVPFEVKSAWNTQSKSLNAYRTIEKPKYAIRLSLKNYGESEGLYSVPLYLVASYKEMF